MIVLSFNVKGLGCARKNLALKQLVKNHDLNVILLHETMCEGAKATA